MNKLTRLIKQGYLYFDRKILLWILKKIYNFSGQQIHKREVNKDIDDWREQTIADFKVWISQVENRSDPQGGDPMDECDLFTLLAEFLSLKKQIQLQNREQSKNIKCLKDFNEFAQQGHAILSLLEKKIDRLNSLEEKIREDALETAVKAFLDVRDTLVRGVDSGGKIGSASFLFGRKKIADMIEGHVMALRKFDLSLAMLDTFPIDTHNKEFNPGTMMAVDTQHRHGVKNGMVIDEICGGFTRKNKVIRLAQVTVNK